MRRTALDSLLQCVNDKDTKGQYLIGELRLKKSNQVDIYDFSPEPFK